MIMNHIHLNSFHLQKNHQFPIWTFFWFSAIFQKKQQNNLTFRAHHHSPSITKLRVLDSDGSKFITLDFWDPPSYRCFGETASEWREERTYTRSKTGPPNGSLGKSSEHTPIFLSVFEVGFRLVGIFEERRALNWFEVWICGGFQVRWKDDGSSFPWYD